MRERYASGISDETEKKIKQGREIYEYPQVAIPLDSTKEKESEEEEQLTFFELLVLHLFLAPICKFKKTFPNVSDIIVIIALLFVFFAVFFGGSRYVEY